MRKNSLSFGGIPTAIDIQKLREMYPADELKIGDLIPYEDVENLLKLNKRSLRFKTITNRWRGLILKETPYIIGCERGVGFKVLNDSEKVDLSGDKLRYAAKSMRMSLEFGSKVNTRNLNDEELSRFNLNNDRSAKALATLQIKSRKELPEMAPTTLDFDKMKRRTA